MEYPKKELIKEIADLFEDYEETYVPGEWESFSTPKRRYPFFSPWMKVAAVLFLIVSAVPFKVKDLIELKGTGTTGLVKNNVAQKANAQTGHEKSVAAIIAKPQNHTASPVFVDVDVVNSSSNVVRTQPVAVESKLPAYGRVSTDSVVAASKYQALASSVNPSAVTKAEVNKPAVPRDTITTAKKIKLNTMDFLASESKANSKYVKKKDLSSKWDFGVLVMPTVTGSNTNVSAGVSTAYRISDKFSLSSGISMLQLESGRNVTPDASSQVSLMSISDKKLLAVDANIKAIDIPVGLIYKVTKNFYTSAGISFLNVLSEQRSNTYSQTSPVSKMATNLSGAAFSYRVLETDQVAESAPDNPLKGNSYLGFFNFSVGRQQHISNRYSIQIEPFIKVPVGKLSAEDLKLMNSGVKFQLSF